MTLGVDTRLTPDLKGGVAVGLGDDRARSGLDGSALSTRNVNAMAYASYQPFRSIHVDGVLGYGALRFGSMRWSTYADSFLSGNRAGNSVYGSLSVTSAHNFGKWRVAPYLRFDLVRTVLGAYADSGDPAWALSYQATTAVSKSAALGLRVAYDFEAGSYRITPSARAEAVRFINGRVPQFISYANDNSIAYSMVLPGDAHMAYQGSLGLSMQTRDGVKTGVESMVSAAGSGGGFMHGVRGTLQIPF